MKILFLLSSLEPAGSETYCVALAKAWGKKHEVHWISDQLHYGQEHLSLPIHKKAFPGGLLNTIRVRNYARKHGIQLIHSHSRRSNWIAAQASWMLKIPHVATLHQLMPVHFFSQQFPCLGDISIAIDEAVADQLRGVFKRPAGRVRLIRNGIDLNLFIPAPRTPPHAKQILLIGRLTGGRWRAFQFFLETLKACAKRLPPTSFKVIGRIPEDRRATLVNQLSILNGSIAPTRVELLGHVNDLVITIRNCDGVIAAGRSALESLASGKPVLMMGEGAVLGLCRANTWPAALRTNLGDHISQKDFNANFLETALRDLLSPHLSDDLIRWGRQQVEQYYDVRRTAQEVDQAYQWLISRS
jgi:glycosyltransferase involved in cell wall biosynthesis